MEEEINQKERDIERICMKLLMQQQPVASDLRVISAAMKMVSDMERIGDQACDITGIVKKDAEVLTIRENTHLDKMAKATISMVSKSIQSFIKQNLVIAHEVIEQDDIVDELFNRVKKETISLIHEDPGKGEECVAIVMIAKYFERIGDHASNIAEWVEFAITGEYKGQDDTIHHQKSAAALAALFCRKRRFFRCTFSISGAVFCRKKPGALWKLYKTEPFYSL